jgi:hypothetical protein
MIDKALILLREELIEYLVSKGYTGAVNASNIVMIENVGLFESQAGDDLDNRILLTLVNLEEESTLKNGPFSNKVSGLARYENPVVYLNLYLLVSSCYSGGVLPNNNYIEALARLSWVIRFFQSRNTFSTSTSPVALPPEFFTEEIMNMKLTVELYTLTFEQINHLWGSLGGRQMPFVLYKIRLLAISEHKTLREVPLIQEIENNSITIPDLP